MADTTLTRFLAEQTSGRLREMRAEARREIEEAQKRLEELEADLARIEAALAEKSRGRGSLTVRTDPTVSPRVRSGVSMKDSILAIMSERPTEAWTTQDVLDELDRRSLAPGGAKPMNTVGNRLLDLVKAKRIYKVGRGAYSLASRPSLLSDNDGSGDPD